MEYQLLGKTGIKISRITFGCWEMGGGPWEFTSDQNNIALIHAALENGVTTFDTAEIYGSGHSEEVLGAALEGRRQDCVVATKVSPDHLRAADVRTAVTASLKRLRMDYVDIYYIHWPNADIAIEETMAEMNKLKQEGLIRAIGVSNFDLDLLKQALSLGRVDVIQPEYSLLHRAIEDGVLPFCLDNEISVCSYSSIAKGILTGAYHLGGKVIKEDDFRATRRLFLKDHLEKETELIHLIKRVADEKGVSLSQIAIGWLLHQQGLSSAILGTQSEKHLLDNLKSLDVKLSAEELAVLSDVSSKVIRSL